MSKLLLSAISAVILASCTPPPPVPPPRFTPNPPYPPQPVDPYGQNTDVSPPPPTTSPSSPPADLQAPGGYPAARRTAKPGEVISPYEPYNVIDVTGFTSGQLARDPSNKKIFRVP